MQQFFDVAQAVSDTKDAAEATRLRKPIGFWRAFIALFMGAGVGIFLIVLPGLVAMWSFRRWMEARSQRPVAALAVGLVTTTIVMFLLLMVPVAVFEESWSAGIIRAWQVGAIAISLVGGYFLARYLFASPKLPA